MIRELIYERLKQKAFQEQHKVMKLEWQRAELERKIINAKKERCIEKD